MRRAAVRVFPLLLLVASSGWAAEERYPARPIRLVSAAPGGSADFVTRLLAAGLGALGQPVVVDNRGGSVAIPAEIVSKSAPDGYTLLSIASPFWVAPLLQKELTYDPIKDFAPVTLATRSPSVLLVQAALPANSVRELIALAKARPGSLNYGSGPTGATSHIAPELFKRMAGVQIVRVPYKGTGPALAGLLSDQVQMMFSSPELALPHVKSNRLKALGVTSRRPFPQLPDVPPIADAGVPGFQTVAIVAVFAPARTPRALVERISRESAKALTSAETRQRLLNAGAEAVGSSPAELADTIRSEMSALAKLIQDAGIRAD